MKSILRLHSRDDLSFDVVDDLRDYKEIEGYAGIFIGGGNTWDLMNDVRTTGFLHKLIRYYKRGGLIYGGSAGAIILGRHIDTQDDENLIQLKDVSGIDIISGYSVACHYMNNKEEHFKKLAMKNMAPILCLSEDSGAVIGDTDVQCVGDKPCVIFLPDGGKIEILPEGKLKHKKRPHN